MIFLHARRVPLSALLGVLVAVFVACYFLGSDARRSAAACDYNNPDDNAKIDCWLDVIQAELHRDGVTAAMHAFRQIYDRYPFFADSGCHRHAHRVGDMVYYEQYLALKDLDKVDFPPETTSCGYGFFHGFLEHLIQDNARSEFIDQTCAYLDKRLGSTMGDIRATCYHGSGHGLSLAHAADTPRALWGNASAFINKPLDACEALPKATTYEIDECRQGVFNVLVDWMETNEYGFSFDDSHPFAICNAQPERRKFACYYEMSMKLDRLSVYDPRILASITSRIPVKQFRDTAFRVGIAGMMQHVVGKHGEYDLFSLCSELENEYVGMCAGSIVSGLFEHGEPRAEYNAAFAFCSSKPVIDRDVEGICWDEYSARIHRFYPKDVEHKLCGMIPAAFRTRCEGYRKQCYSYEDVNTAKR